MSNTRNSYRLDQRHCGQRNHLPYRTEPATRLWTGTERMDKWDAALIARTHTEEGIIKNTLINKRTLRDL